MSYESEEFDRDLSLAFRPRTLQEAQIVSGGFEATGQAVLSSVKNQMDMPIGAVVQAEGNTTGRGFAKDQSTGIKHLHAEVVAIGKAVKKDKDFDTLISTVEPCFDCQDYIARFENIKAVHFVLPRMALLQLGLVNPAKTVAEERAKSLGYGYTVTQLVDPTLFEYNKALMEATTRSPGETGDTTSVDTVSVVRKFVDLNARGFDLATLDFDHLSEPQI